MVKKNIALIGCGYWGTNLLRNYHSLGVLAAICDSNEDLAIQKSNEYSVQYLKYDQILSDKNIQGVVIAAQAPLHFDLANEALDNNKHVYVEKPLAMNLSDADYLIEKAAAKNLRLMVGHIMQYHPVFQKLKNLVHKKKIGDINYIYSNRKSFGIFRSEENVVLSLAPHDVSMILSLINEYPSSIKSFKGSFIQKGIDDFANIHLDFSNNVKASINVSWLNPIKEQKLTIIGSKGMLVFDDTLDWSQKLAFYDHKIDWTNSHPVPLKKEVQYVKVNYSEPLREECKHFIKLIENQVGGITDGLEGRNVLAVLEAANKE